MESFWCKIMFKEFIKHFRKLDDKAIVKDIKDSMDALENMDGSGNSFGAKMIAWSNSRIEENRKQRVEAGKKSGKARAERAKLRKNLAAEDGGDREDSKDLSTSNDGDLESATSSQQDFSVTPQRSGVSASSRSRRKFRAPSTEELYDFCCDNGLDEADARDCYEMCASRNWTDRKGNTIVDWKSFTEGFCDSRRNKRRVS